MALSNNMRFYLVLSIWYLVLAKVAAQPAEGIRNLLFGRLHAQISPAGDTTSIHLQQHKGKLVILDFWNRSCSACIQQMPKLYGLQLEYPDDIVILPVTKDDLKTVTGAFAKQVGGAYEFRLPSIYNDTVLNDLFGVMANPDVVWLRDGNFLAKTSGEAVNSQMVQLVLKGDLSFLNQVARMSKEQFYTYSPIGDRTEGAEARDPTILSVEITPYAHGLSTNMLTYRKQTNRQNERLAYINKTLYEIVRSLYSDEDDLETMQWRDDNRNRSILRSERVEARFKDMDSLKKIGDFRQRTSFREKHLFCLRVTGYDSLSSKECKLAAIRVLEASLGIKTGIERQIVRCRVLQGLPTSVTDFLPGNRQIPLHHRVSLPRVFDLLRYFNNIFVEEPLLVGGDTVGLDGHLGLVLDKRLTAQQTIDYLQSIGFKFKMKMHNVGFIAID